MATQHRVKSFASEDDKIHGIAQSSIVHPKQKAKTEAKRLVTQGYWVEVFDADTNELISEHSPE